MYFSELFVYFINWHDKKKSTNLEWKKKEN